MQHLRLNPTQPRTLNQKLHTALENLKTAAQNWDGAETNAERADRYGDSAERDFRQAEFPARNASFDNARRDSSWDGRDLDRSFRSGGRAVDNSQFELRGAQSKLNKVEKTIDSEQVNLQDVAAELEAAKDERAVSVRKAIEELGMSDQSFDRVDREWRTADSATAFTGFDIRRAESDIQQIIFDRPGRDVSHYGFRVSSSLNSIQGDLRTMDFALSRSGAHGDKGESHLDAAIALLQQTVS